MKLANQIVVFLLVAAMSLVAALPARAGIQGAHAIEICDEGAIRIIYVDENGQELPADPICNCLACPHGITPTLALLPSAPEFAATPRNARPAEFFSARTRQTCPQPPLRSARGPPATKAQV